MRMWKTGCFVLIFSAGLSMSSFAMGWTEQAGARQYEKEDGAYARQEWIQDNGKWYYLNEDGIMVTGWHQEQDQIWYYLKSDGSMASGEWIEENGMRYYLEASGRWNPLAEEDASSLTDVAEETRYEEWISQIYLGDPEEPLVQ